MGGELKRLSASLSREQRGLRMGKTRLHPTNALFVVCIALISFSFIQRGLRHLCSSQLPALPCLWQTPNLRRVFLPETVIEASGKLSLVVEALVCSGEGQERRGLSLLLIPLLFNTRFLNLSTIALWGQRILCWGDCPVHCRTYNSISGPQLLEASSTHASLPTARCDGQKCLHTLTNILIGQNRPGLRTT